MKYQWEDDDETICKSSRSYTIGKLHEIQKSWGILAQNCYSKLKENARVCLVSDGAKKGGRKASKAQLFSSNAKICEVNNLKNYGYDLQKAASIV